MKTYGVILLKNIHNKLHVLLVHQVYSNKWSFPKGQDDKVGETHLACAMRELEEEAGVKPGSYRILGDVSYITHTFFVARLMDSKCSFKTNDPGEIDSIVWVPFNDLRMFAKANRCNSTIGGLINMGRFDDVEKMLRGAVSCKEYCKAAPRQIVRSDAPSWRVRL